MAAGFIYILINPAFQDDLLKIGKTTRTPSQRAQEISTTGVPTEFQVSFAIETSDCDFSEALVHNRLMQKRYSSNREFFKIPLKEAIDIVTSAVEDAEKMPLENRVFVPRQRKIILSKRNVIKDFELGEWNVFTEIQDNTTFIKKATNTVFRQNNMLLDGAEIYFTLSGYSWSGSGEKDAMVYFSRPSRNLVVIPRKTVDLYMFERLFEKTPRGYYLKAEYNNFGYDKNRINLKFKTELDRLLIILKAPTALNVDPIPLISLPSVYWPEIDLSKYNSALKFAEEINNLCQTLSGGEGILVI